MNGNILCCMLNHGHVSSAELIRNLGSEFIRIRFFDLLKDSSQKLLLIFIDNLFLRFLNFFLIFYLRLLFLLIFFIFSHESPTIFSHHMVIVCPIWIFLQQKRKLWLILLYLNQSLLKLGSVFGNVQRCLFHHFLYIPRGYNHPYHSLIT